MISCETDDLVAASTCFRCDPRQSLESIKTYLLCQWARNATTIVSTIIMDDGFGNFWQLIVAPGGLLGAQAAVGPATPNVVFDDGSGFFWLLIIGPGGLVGTSSTLGPATGPVILSSGPGDFWQVFVDLSGNLGTVSV